MNLNIVLFEPEIPQNTGNIARTCVLTSSKLHLIKPLGFDISEKNVKRAGLDYWKDLNLEVHDNYYDFKKKYGCNNIYIATTHGKKYYYEINYKKDDFILFGRESSGLPDYIREENIDNSIRIPIISTSTRSLNLANSVSIIIYEALRQLNFINMK